MNVEAIYENGRLTLPSNIRLKRERVKMRIDIPDDALVSESYPERSAPEASDIRERIQTILGPDRDMLTEAVASADSDLAIWHRHLEEKHLGGD